jgi:hypothetical protein
MPTKYWISTSSGSFNTAANWSDTLAPANNDTLIFGAYGTADVNANLSTILTGVTVIVEKAYPGKIGTISGGTFTPLVLDGGTARIGESSGGPGSQPGSSQIMLDFGTTAATVTVYDTASSGAFNSTYPAVMLDGTVLTVHHFGGTVGVASETANTATLASGRVSGSGTASVAPRLYLGRGVTVTALFIKNGVVHTRGTPNVGDVIISDGGLLINDGTGTYTTLQIYGGRCNMPGTGTITSLAIGNGGVFDRTMGTGAITLSSTALYAGASLLLDNGVLNSTTTSGGISYQGCAIQDVVITLPDGDQAGV